MKKFLYIAVSLLMFQGSSYGQGLHFSQIPSSPLLINPSNAGLLPYDNYRVGVQYRNQWNNVPVNYNTIGAWGDVQVLRNRNETNWLGVGAAFYNDKAGDGILTLNQLQASLAYHIQVNYASMLSVGFYGAFNQRTLDFNKLSYDVQWNGVKFDKNLSNQEPFKMENTNYLDLGAGVNYAVFPNENLYAKFGVGVLHINRATETFYSRDNKLGYRPTFSAEAIAKLNKNVIINPVLYASTQKKAYEVLFGSMVSYNVDATTKYPSIFSIGAFYRWNDAFIAVVGYEFNKVKLMLSYDATVSGMSSSNQLHGAFEVSLIYQGLYPKNSQRNMGGYNCPRF